MMGDGVVLEDSQIWVQILYLSNILKTNITLSIDDQAVSERWNVSDFFRLSHSCRRDYYNSKTGYLLFHQIIGRKKESWNP